uniref:Uncharacterized protein n=1 Tax=Compsopogon caeruleus TaxID=31354 RepID=A0A7S1TC44_9RHOD|mmetsp:Transcript_16944/g.35155  ORF Transcript_16944/g.35155 Transcript_16944/m.35155 type:complete len:119 (+) Transcript_16944:203-559(+)
MESKRLAQHVMSIFEGPLSVWGLQLRVETDLSLRLGVRLQYPVADIECHLCDVEKSDKYETMNRKETVPGWTSSGGQNGILWGFPAAIWIQGAAGKGWSFGNVAVDISAQLALIGLVE